jgi:hypothetical protein
MWIVKGALLGTGFFLVGTVLFLIMTMWPFRTGVATGISALTAYTTHNPLWFLALAASVALGCAIVGSWPVRVP